MSASQRLAQARRLRGEFPLPALCRALGVSRSSLCRPSPKEKDLAGLLALVEAELLRWPRYGARRMHAHLRRLGVSCTRSEVSLVYGRLGVLFSRPARKKPRTTDSSGVVRFPDLARGLSPTAPDQLWVADVTSVPVGARWAYLALLTDAFTRRVVGWALSSHNDTALTLAALEQALAFGRPCVHHSDGGTNYAAKAYVSRLQSLGTRVSMTAPDRPQDNGVAERLNRTVKDEEVGLGAYDSLEQARLSLGEYVRRYNEERVHQALGYRTPAEALHQYLAERSRRQDPSLERPRN
jgi:putative transposase